MSNQTDTYHIKPKDIVKLKQNIDFSHRLYGMLLCKAQRAEMLAKVVKINDPKTNPHPIFIEFSLAECVYVSEEELDLVVAYDV